MTAASASVLPPAPAHRSTTCWPGLAPASSAESCEPSSCTSTRPLMKAGSAWIAGFLASASSAMRRPTGDQRVGTASRWASASRAASGSALRPLTRRSSGARLALGYALLAEHAGEMRIEPLRIVARDPGRSAGEVGCREPRPLLRAQRRRRKAPTVGARRDRVAIELALEPQHAEDSRARVLVAHDVDARGAPAQRIVNQPRDRGAIG